MRQFVGGCCIYGVPAEEKGRNLSNHSRRKKKVLSLKDRMVVATVGTRPSRILATLIVVVDLFALVGLVNLEMRVY